MITLYTFPEAFGLRNVSPFCLKVEMALTWLNIDFNIVLESDPRKSPKGKLPYIVVDGEVIADSELIFEYLETRSGAGLYGGLTEQEYARGVAYTRLVEDHLYWMLVASRWIDDGWFPNIKQGFFGQLPPVIRSVAAGIARKQVSKTYELHGLGKHNLQEQSGFARRDFRALSGALRQSDYLLGDRLTVFDFGAASLLAGIYDNEPATWVTNIAQEFPILREYAERVQSDLGVYCRRL